MDFLLRHDEMRRKGIRGAVKVKTEGRQSLGLTALSIPTVGRPGLPDIPVLGQGKSWHFKHLTIKHIYFPLAKSSGKVLELLRALKSNDGDRQKKLFQFFNELGARALRIHIGRVLEMAESSSERYAYERKIAERFGGQQELELIVPPLLPPPPESMDDYGAKL